MLSASTKSVIPESAAGGYPESREKNSLLDTPSTSLRVVSLSNHGSRPPQADSSGMTFGVFPRLFHQSHSPDVSQFDVARP